MPKAGNRPRRLAAVLGHPISHSRSPALHAAAYRQLGLDIGYYAADIQEAELPRFVEALRLDQDWLGLSVTMPLKSAMVPLLDRLKGEAARLGVVNTVTFDYSDPGQPRLTGHNSDVVGLVRALQYAGVRQRPAVALLGGGGTAVAAVAAAAELGAAAVDIFVRSGARASPTAKAATTVGLPHRFRPWSEAAGALAGYDLVISTLPPHAADELARELNTAPAAARADRDSPRLLLDVAYDPWPSALAAGWESTGGTTVSGLEMLLYQAVEQVRLFTADRYELSPAVINVMCDAVGLPQR
ncbi:shikimate dehydrogenase [Paenarthrobacter sp. Z7-10]|nr:shikimate dehydrogenase [Paenarthrobacter sp. Z7-10]